MPPLPPVPASSFARTPDADQEMLRPNYLSHLPEGDRILVAAVLDALGHVATIAERSALDMRGLTTSVQDLRAALAEHHAREEKALTACEVYFNALAASQAARTGAAVADAEAAVRRVEVQQAEARAAWLRLASHPLTIAVAVALLSQIAAFFGVSAGAVAP